LTRLAAKLGALCRIPALPTSAGSIACRASIEGLGGSGVSIGTAFLPRHFVK
jgi:hypothetical protein